MLISWMLIFRDHLKLLLKCYLSFCGSTNTLKLRVLQYILQTSQIKILTSYRSYLKIAGPYHGSILKIYMNIQISSFSVGSIPTKWKKLIFDYSDINENDLYQNHHVIKGARILSLSKLSSKEIYSILI